MVRGVGELDQVEDPEVRRAGLGWAWRVCYLPAGGGIGMETGGRTFTRWGAERRARKMHRALVRDRSRGPDAGWERIDP